MATVLSSMFVASVVMVADKEECMYSPSLSMGWALLATVAIILLATLAVGAWWPTNSTGKWEYTPVSAIVKTGLPQN